VELRSDWSDDVAVVPLDVADPARVEPAWARYVAGVVAALRPQQGFTGTVTTTLPVGAGLSSSAALEVAAALALGFEGTALELANLCRAAEHAASGVPCGIMDQLASAAGVAGHALRIDCTTLDVTPVLIPDDVAVLVVHSGEARSLATSDYADRAAACQAAEALVGPLREASLAAVASIEDAVLRRRARHVVTENARVDTLVAALPAGDRAAMRETMAASHTSLRDDFEVSTPALDRLVDELARSPGVIGARLTGAGFGGCVVALTEAGAALPHGRRAWRVRPSSGARRMW
jgi:galactokinase